MRGQIATTQWSQVLAARDGSQTEGLQALEVLCPTYWQPLYAYIRHQGADSDEARDLTQGFFAELLEKDILASVDPSKGRFRAFLLAAVRNFLSHERVKSGRLKRGGGVSTLALDVEAGEERYVVHAIERMTPEDVFEHRWAVTVLDRAMSRLAAEARGSGSERQFESLKPFLTSGEPHAPYREVAAELAMTEGAVKVAVHRLRKRFGQALRLEIAQTVQRPEEVDGEVRHLLEVIRR